MQVAGNCFRRIRGNWWTVDEEVMDGWGSKNKHSRGGMGKISKDRSTRY